MMEWAPPVDYVAQQVLSSRSDAGKEALKAARKAWEERHKPLVAADAPRLPVARRQVRLCQLAGFCLCGPGGMQMRAVASAIEAQLRQALLKDSRGRRIYDKGLLVLRLISDEDSELWAHMSYINHASYRMSLLPLRRSADTDLVEAAAVLDRVPLEVSGGLPTMGACNLWEWLRSADLDDMWHLELHALYTGAAAVPEFRPSEYLLVEKEGETHIVCRGCPARRRVRRARHGPGGGPLPLPPPLGPPGVARAGEDFNAEDENFEAPYVDAEGSDGIEDPLLVDEVAGVADLGRLQDFDPWDPDAFGDGEGAESGEEDLGAGGALAPALVPPAGDQPHPVGPAAAGGAPPFPPPPAEYAGGHGGRGAGPGLKRFALPGMRSDLRLDRTKNTVSAHCIGNGHGSCRMERVMHHAYRTGTGASGRPLGTLVAWLRRGSDCRNRPTHKATQPALTLEERREARTWAMGVPSLQELFDMERPQRENEGSEPEEIP